MFKDDGYTFKGDNTVKKGFASFLERVYSERKEFAPYPL